MAGILERSENKKALVIGAGLSGSVIARELAEHGYIVSVWDLRDHVGGNMYDYLDEHGFLVQKYGPHAFHTNDEELVEYISKFENWMPYHLKCGAFWDGKFTPTPFNFDTIKAFYSPNEAYRTVKKFTEMFSDISLKELTVANALNHQDADIRSFAEFLYVNDYSLYTAKQWGVEPDKIDSSVLARVPIRFSYEDGYFNDKYQLIPQHSYSSFFCNLLDHKNIKIYLGVQALDHICIREHVVEVDGKRANYPVVYTGTLDSLFKSRFGRLPYRSLRFEWKYSEKESLQEVAIVAYPKAKDYTRITEYKKLPFQQGKGTVYAIEYPIAYSDSADYEPYYPVQTNESHKQYKCYADEAAKVENLYCVGRLADFRYYNMDQALKRALECSEEIMGKRLK